MRLYYEIEDIMRFLTSFKYVQCMQKKYTNLAIIAIGPSLKESFGKSSRIDNYEI